MKPTESHSKNEVKINKAKKDVPFCTRFYNRPTVDTICDSPTCTNDYYAESCDINVIIAKHMMTGTPLPSIDKAIYNLNEQGELVGEKYGAYQNLVDRYIAAKNNFLNLISR